MKGLRHVEFYFIPFVVSRSFNIRCRFFIHSLPWLFPGCMRFEVCIHLGSFPVIASSLQVFLIQSKCSNFHFNCARCELVSWFCEGWKTAFRAHKENSFLILYIIALCASSQLLFQFRISSTVL